jgi:hypothetical protein
MPVVEEWERRRACLTLGKPEWWNEKAGEAQHRTAMFVCRRRCPVLEQCARKAEQDILAGVALEGFYAGRIWEPAPRKVEAVPEERRCAGPECTNTFIVSPRCPHRLVCSDRCAGRRKREIDKRRNHDGLTTRHRKKAPA